MAYSTVTYTATSSSDKVHDVTFSSESGGTPTAVGGNNKPYINISHIKVKLNGVAVASGSLTADESDPTTTITIAAGVTVAEGDKIEVYRETPRIIDDRTVDFVDASLLAENDLDLSAIHGQFMIQEALDSLSISLLQNHLGDLDAGALKITNLDTPTGATDACTKDYVDTQAIFGGLASAQVWDLLGDGTADTFALTAPDPVNDVNELFVCTVRGDGLAPSSNDGVTVRDFNVYKDVLGVYQIKFEAVPVLDARIIVQNMGVAKSTLTGELLFASGGTSETPLTLKGYSGQTGDLFVVQNSAAEELLAVDEDGAVTSADILIKSDAANLLECKTAAGASLYCHITAAGNLGLGLTTDDAQTIAVGTRAADKKGVLIRGSDAQTAALLLIQSNEVVEGVTTVASVSPNGSLSAAKGGLLATRNASTNNFTHEITATSAQTGAIELGKSKTGTNYYKKVDDEGTTSLSQLSVGGVDDMEDRNVIPLTVQAHDAQADTATVLAIKSDDSTTTAYIQADGKGQCVTDTSGGSSPTVPLGGGVVAAGVIAITSGSRTLTNALNCSVSIGTSPNAATQTNVVITGGAGITPVIILQGQSEINQTIVNPSAAGFTFTHSSDASVSQSVSFICYRF